MIRKAKKEDYRQVEEIMQQVHRMHVTWRPDIYRSMETVMPEKVFQELVDCEKVLVYTEKDRVTGLAIFWEKVVSGGVHAYRKTVFVDTIAVLEGCRGKGIGSRLLDEIKRKAREQDCCGLELQVNARNQNARKMYQNYGFQEKSINLELDFSQESCKQDAEL